MYVQGEFYVETNPFIYFALRRNGKREWVFDFDKIPLALLYLNKGAFTDTLVTYDATEAKRKEEKVSD